MFSTSIVSRQDSGKLFLVRTTFRASSRSGRLNHAKILCLILQSARPSQGRVISLTYSCFYEGPVCRSNMIWIT